MLIYKGKIIAGGGTIVMPMTRAEYEANKTVLDSADVWVDLTDEPDSIADGECIQYDSDMNFEDIGNIATKAIAKVEPSDTALYLHEVGTYFINKDGNSCKTDVQISVGGTITLGTNCHVVDGVANDINSNKSNYIKNVTNQSTILTQTGSSVTPISITISNDGYYRFLLRTSASNEQVVVACNGNTILSLYNEVGSYQAVLPIKSGTTITVLTYGTGTYFQASYLSM